MIFPDESPEDWSKKHKIQIVMNACPKCGTLRVANIPTRTKSSKGFISEEHGCGDKYRLYTCVANNLNGLTLIMGDKELE